MSKRLFKQHFATHRQQQAQWLEVQRWQDIPQWWTVKNAEKASSYPVVVGAAGPVCRCEDYRNQQKILGKGVCKHGYAVLSALGFGSLREYLSAA